MTPSATAASTSPLLGPDTAENSLQVHSLHLFFTNTLCFMFNFLIVDSERILRLYITILTCVLVPSFNLHRILVSYFFLGELLYLFNYYLYLFTDNLFTDSRQLVMKSMCFFFFDFFNFTVVIDNQTIYWISLLLMLRKSRKEMIIFF